MKSYGIGSFSHKEDHYLFLIFLKRVFSQTQKLSVITLFFNGLLLKGRIHIMIMYIRNTSARSEPTSMMTEYTYERTS